MDASASFDAFVSASTFRTIQQTFLQLCLALEIDPSEGKNVYEGLRKFKDWKAEKLWKLLDKRVNQKEYLQQKAADKLTTLIIGAGPCGLRMAIECALLGNRVVVVEQREKFSRNNVLHLWGFVIHDIKALGAKIFYPKFCTGSIEHISIRQLQCILLKVALCFGVQVHEGVSFKEIVFPSIESKCGFKAMLEPPGHILSEMEFDVLIGADGKRNTVPGFRRDELRGKLAIAITANFINKKTPAEEKVPEISGVAYIFNQAFFKEMHETTGVDLENIVYYKDETHYFVMCAKKHSLLEMGVLKKDSDDAVTLLSSNNLDKEALCAYAVKAAHFATNGALPALEFAENHRGEKDIAAFDFTSLYSAKNSVRLVESNGKRLLLSIVGDSLHEPFWPTGSGCARGFLGVFDTAWLLRNYGLNQKGPLEMIAERESVYRLLTQVTKDNMHKLISKYTIDPRTRYLHPGLCLEPDEVVSLVYSDNPRSLPVSEPLPLNYQGSAHSREIASITRYSLWKFCCYALMNYKLKVIDLNNSWCDGLALGGLIAKFAPKSLDYFYLLNLNDAHKRLQVCFDAAELNFNVPIPCCPSAWEYLKENRKAEYLEQIVNVIRKDMKLVQQCLITPRSFKRKIVEKPRLRAYRRATQPIEKLASDLLESFKSEDKTSSTKEYESVKRFERLKRQESDPTSRHAGEKFSEQEKKSGQENLKLNDFIVKDKKLQKEGSSKKVQYNFAEFCHQETPLDFSEGSEKENGLKNSGSAQLKRKDDSGTCTDTLNVHKQTLCDFCEKVVYLTERIQIESVYIHKNCFRCSICSQILRVGEYGKDKELDLIHPKKLFCNVHSRIPLKEKISQLERVNRKRQSLAVLPMKSVSENESKDTPASCFHHILSTPQHMKESRSIISPISELTCENLRTPERAEFGYHVEKTVEYSKLDDSESEEDEQSNVKQRNSKQDSDGELSVSDSENLEEADLEEFQKSVLQLDDENPEMPVTDEQLMSIINRMNQRRKSLLPDGTPTRSDEPLFRTEVTFRSTNSTEAIDRDRARSIATVPSETGFSEFKIPLSVCIRKQKEEELEKLKSEMRLKAKMKSDHELGIKSNIIEEEHGTPEKFNTELIHDTPSARKPRSSSLLAQMPSLWRESLNGLSSSVPSLIKAETDKNKDHSEPLDLSNENCLTTTFLHNDLHLEKTKKSVFQSDDLHIESKKETGMLESPYHLFKKKEKKKRETNSSSYLHSVGKTDNFLCAELPRVATVPPSPRSIKESPRNCFSMFDDSASVNTSQIPSDAITLKNFHKKAQKLKKDRDLQLSQSAQELQLTIDRNGIRLEEISKQIKKKVLILECEPNNQAELIRWLELIKERDSLKFTNKGKQLELLKVKLHLRYRDLNKKYSNSEEMADERTLNEMLRTVHEKTEADTLLKSYHKESMRSLPRIEDVLRNKKFSYLNFGVNFEFASLF
ncbi:unnamed protein product [Auanema sp. JU1783]|nr:unnamed protein product [Auanema sp. JU1783]